MSPKDKYLLILYFIITLGTLSWAFLALHYDFISDMNVLSKTVGCLDLLTEDRPRFIING